MEMKEATNKIKKKNAFYLRPVNMSYINIKHTGRNHNDRPLISSFFQCF